MNRKANSKIMKPFIVSFFIIAQAISAWTQMPMQAPRMNMPSLSAPQVPNSQQRAAEEQSRIQQQNAAMMQRQTAQREQQTQQLQEARRTLRPGIGSPINYDFPEKQDASTVYFKQAMAEIQDMLDGKQPLNLKRAVFLSENALFDGKMSYDGFCNEIAMNIDVFQAFMEKEGLSMKDDVAKKYLLQKFFSDTLTMKQKNGGHQFTQPPFKYDFEDPMGEKDPRKQCVSKLLAEKKGQCHSLPLLYLIFAEALDVKAWLSYSPQHSYIKLQDGRGVWYNFETTNGHYSTDSWVLSSGYVKAEALKSKIYMDTLSKRETIAACLVDMANYYTKRFDNAPFVLACLNKALEYCPKNIVALQLKADYYTTLFQYVALQLGYPPKEMLHLFPEANSIFKKYNELYVLIDKSGYQDMPENVYQDWLKSFENQKAQQPIKVIKP